MFGLAVWNRVVAVLPAAASAPPTDPRVRRLTASDTEAVGGNCTQRSAGSAKPGAALPGLPHGLVAAPRRAAVTCGRGPGTTCTTPTWTPNSLIVCTPPATSPASSTTSVRACGRPSWATWTTRSASNCAPRSGNRRTCSALWNLSDPLEATLASRLADHPALAAIAADLLDLIRGCHLKAYAPLPDAPSPALRRVLTGHTSWVLALAVAPDGSWLASAGDDGAVRLWDPAGGTETHTLTGHSGPIGELAVAPDGSWLASAGDDDTVRLWDLSRIAAAAALRVDGALTALCVIRGALVAAGEHGPYWLRIKRIGAGS
jgi:WD40 repeat protein